MRQEWTTVTASTDSSHDEAFSAVAAPSSALASAETHDERMRLITLIQIADDGLVSTRLVGNPLRTMGAVWGSCGGGWIRFMGGC